MALTTPVVGANIEKPTYLPNGLNLDVTGTNFPLQQGVPLQNVYMFKVVPAPESTTCIAASGSWLGATTSYTLRTSAVTSGAFVISSPVTVSGVAGVKLDCERGVSVTFASASTQDTTFIFTGYDYRGVAIQFSQPLGSGVTGTINVGTPMSIITSITATANPGVNVSFGNAASSGGTGSWIGLPYACRLLGYVVAANWNGIPFTVSSANSYLADPWRANPPTSLPDGTSDIARGIVELPSVSDGSKVLTLTYFVEGSDKELDGQLSVRNQSALNLLQVEQNSNDEFVWPNLTTYDLVGMQYPGDLVAATEYAALLAV